MLLATWNVNGIRARLTRVLEWLAERKPDVVCLQELKVKDAEFPYAELERAGYLATVVGQQSWNGVGVIAREKPEAIARELPGMGAAGARLITAMVRGVQVTSVYVPNGKKVSHPDYEPKLAWLARLAEHVESRDRGVPYVIAGDFNVCPTDLDSYLGAEGAGIIFHTEPERERLARISASGLVDLFRAKYPAEQGFSFWDYRAGFFHKRLGMRIDMIFASEDIAARCKEIKVDREFRKKSKISKALPSDHAPVIADIDDDGSVRSALTAT